MVKQVKAYVIDRRNEELTPLEVGVDASDGAEVVRHVLQRSLGDWRTMMMIQ